jgi:hypothetical protein
VNWLALALWSCVRPECTPADYRRAECRVQAANTLARVRTADGIEVRFQDPDTDDTASWTASGRVHVAEDGRVEARVAGLGRFRLTVHPPVDLDGAPIALVLQIDNVHPDAPALDFEIERTGLSRRLVVPLDQGLVEIRGELPADACDGPRSVVALGDVQTNPLQLQRILEVLHDEANLADGNGQPLLGIVLLGDLAEDGTRDELEAIADLLRNAPVPTAVVPGNHDIYSAHDAVYNEVFGPGNHAFDVCDARFVLLDTGSGDLANSIVGRLPELLDRADGTRPRFLLSGTHHPPYAAQATIGWTREDQAHLFMAELADRDADLMLAGHAHRRFEHTAAPVRQVVVGTAGASQYAVDPDYGYLRLVFDDALQTCFVPVAAPGSLEPIKDGDPETCTDLP